MMQTFVPVSIDDAVLALCQRIHASNVPVYVQVKPKAAGTQLDCFVNVRAQVDAKGGRIQFGWAIWRCSKYYLEAEHHAVYEPAIGPPWVDVTPPLIPGLSRILFLADDSATYDYDTDQRRDNIRMPLLDDARVQEFCDLATERNSILNSVPGFGAVTLTGDKATRMSYINQRSQMLMAELQCDYERKVGRNDPCPCGSGKKYKKCCGTP